MNTSFSLESNIKLTEVSLNLRWTCIKHCNYAQRPSISNQILTLSYSPFGTFVFNTRSFSPLVLRSFFWPRQRFILIWMCKVYNWLRVLSCYVHVNGRKRLTNYSSSVYIFNHFFLRNMDIFYTQNWSYFRIRPFLTLWLGYGIRGKESHVERNST